MLTGDYPFVSKKNKTLLKEIVKENIKFDNNLHLRHIILLKKMLNKNPEKRLTVNETINYLKSQ